MANSENIIYKIIETWEDTNSIVVRYFTDKLTENELSVDPSERIGITPPVRCRTDVSISLPFPVPSDEEIEEIIMDNVPYESLEFFEKVKDPEIDTKIPERILRKKNKIKGIRKEKIIERRKPKEPAVREEKRLRDLTDEELLAIIERRKPPKNETPIKNANTEPVANTRPRGPARNP